MQKNAMAILVSGVLIAGAVLYGSGSIDRFLNSQPPFAQALKDKFADPDSVRIRNVVHDRSGYKWCGEVNAQNRMGGYVGWQRFIALDGSATGGGWRITVASELGEFSGGLLGCAP